MRNLIYLILLMLTYSCQQKSNAVIGNVKNEEIINSIIPSIPKHIKLDTCKIINVNFDKIFIVNKTFDKLGEIDTLLIDRHLFSVKSAKYIQLENETECCYSRLEIINNGKSVFNKDSISITGMCYFDKQNNMLTIPIINEQYDDLSVTSSLYLCNISTGKSLLVEKELSNCWFALIIHNGENLLYNDADKLIKYNIKLKTKKIIFDFENSPMSIFKLSIKDNNLEIYYFDNFMDFIDVPMKKATITLTKDISEY